VCKTEFTVLKKRAEFASQEQEIKQREEALQSQLKNEIEKRNGALARVNQAKLELAQIKAQHEQLLQQNAQQSDLLDQAQLELKQLQHEKDLLLQKQEKMKKFRQDSLGHNQPKNKKQTITQSTLNIPNLLPEEELDDFPNSDKPLDLQTARRTYYLLRAKILQKTRETLMQMANRFTET